MQVLDINDKEIELRDMDDDDDDLITVDALTKYAEQQQSAKEVEEQAAAEKAEQKSDLIQEIETAEDL